MANELRLRMVLARLFWLEANRAIVIYQALYYEMATPFRCVAEESACVAKWLGWSVTVLAGMFAFTLLVAKIPTDRKNTS